MKKALLIILIVLALAGFGVYKLYFSLSAAGNKADPVVATFHTSYNAGDAAAIYKASAPAFQSSVEEKDFAALITMLRGELGGWKSSERTGINLETQNGETQLQITLESKFEKGTGTEDFYFDYNSDVPTLLGYNVKSPKLIKKPQAPVAPAPAGEDPAKAEAVPAPAPVSEPGNP